MQVETQKIPSHLSRYIVKQDYSRYTAIDQAVWRFIMRRLKHFLTRTAHECYADGLEKTGISTEEIPSIDKMGEKLEKFGWKAVAVSGFIPPAAFMEMQSLGILPIACDMRTLEHAMYTPAPDIVHEAAGHAPILIEPEFADYLREYAQVARRAILNREDLDIYAAIRVLSDLKENPHATDEDVEKANRHLEKTTLKASEPSEAALLARMNWWTAEYGLIGPVDKPKIYGAGLLSSVGESYTALLPKTKKIPFSLECLNFTYDITEPQPQLFVTPDFKTLSKVLHEMAETMAFKKGGKVGLEKMKKSLTVNCIELNSGLQISGILKDYISTGPGQQDIGYIQLTGPCQLAHNDHELPGHGRTRHAEGFGSPIGLLKGNSKCLSTWSDQELQKAGLTRGQTARLEYQSGITVSGRLQSLTRFGSTLALLTFSECTVTRGTEVLFKPEWGEYDMAVGSSIPSVFGGAADRESYGETDDFEAKKVPPHRHPPEFLALNEIYLKIRSLRQSNPPTLSIDLEPLIHRLNKDFPKDWLSRMEILEICTKKHIHPKGLDSIKSFLEKSSQGDSADAVCIRDGMGLIQQGI